MNGMTIPIKNIHMKNAQFKKYGLGYEFQPIEEMIDIEISKNDKTILIVEDDTTFAQALVKYIHEIEIRACFF